MKQWSSNYLIRAPADIDTSDEDGQTPLSWATENDHEAVVKSSYLGIVLTRTQRTTIDSTGI